MTGRKKRFLFDTFTSAALLALGLYLDSPVFWAGAIVGFVLAPLDIGGRFSEYLKGRFSSKRFERPGQAEDHQRAVARVAADMEAAQIEKAQGEATPVRWDNPILPKAVLIAPSKHNQLTRRALDYAGRSRIPFV